MVEAAVQAADGGDRYNEDNMTSRLLSSNRPITLIVIVLVAWLCLVPVGAIAQAQKAP